MIQIEYLIVLGLAGFYIYDSAKILFFNEFYMQKGFRKTFTSKTQTHLFSFLKKYLMLPDFIFPHHLCFKVRWTIKDTSDNETTQQNDVSSILKISKTLKKIQFSIYLNTVLCMVLLPIALILKMSYEILAVLIILIYVINIINAIWVFFHRKSLSLTKMKLANLWIDALFCPPFALNILKKISLNCDVKTDAIFVCKALLDDESFQELLKQIDTDIQQLKMNSDNESFIQQLSSKQKKLIQLGLNDKHISD